MSRKYNNQVINIFTTVAGPVDVSSVRCGGDGVVVFKAIDSSTSVTFNVKDGEYLPVMISEVVSTTVPLLGLSPIGVIIPSVSTPAAPTVTLTAGDGQVSIAWTDGSNGGAEITAHRIYVNGTGMLPITSASPYVLTGLANGVDVSIEVTAINSAGESARSTASVASPASAVPFASVNADGWSVEYSTTPGSTNPLDSIAVSQAGFDDTGATTTVSETLTATQRVRQVYPNQASLSSNRVALSSELISTTTISGVTNNSTLVSPKPIVNWVMTSRVLVGDTVRVGVTGNHWAARSGRPFRAVVFTATDGTTTVTSTVTTMSVSTTGAGDVNAVLAYETDLNISTLANPADITINAKVYPWIGVEASVHDSSLNSGHREFSPRLFRRDTAKLAAPNVVYVATGGVDATGYVGTDPVAAAAAPCLTYTGAINRAREALGITSGSLDNLEIRLTEGTWSLSASATANTTNFCVTVTRAPGAIKANTILNFGTSNFQANVTYLRFKGLNIVRTGAFYLHNGSTGFCVIEDCTFNTNGSTGAIAQTGPQFFWNGVVCPAAMANILGPSTYSHAMIRGVDSQTSMGFFQGFLVAGSKFVGGSYSATGFSEDNSIIQFCSFRNTPSANATVSISGTVTGFSFSQNLIEVIHTTTSTPALRPSSDGNTNNLTHVLMDNITLAAGHMQAGRINGWYDETALTYRTHTFCRMRNPIVGSIYTKGDVFLGTNGNGTPDPTDAPLHTGNWAQLYAVGFKNVHSLFVQTGTNSLGAGEGQAYGGVGSLIATTQTTPQFSLAAGVNFTDWKATTTNSGTGAAVAGAGGGDYTLPSGSAFLGKVAAADEVFPYDLAGVARSRGAVGAYA